MFTLRDVYRNEWSGLASPDAVRRVLPLLEDAGWVRPAELDVAKGQAEPAERIVPGQPQATTEDEMSTSRWLHWTPKEASIIRKTSEPEPTKPTELNFVSFVSAPPRSFQKIEVGKHTFTAKVFPHCPKCASHALYRKNDVGNYECLTCGLLDIPEGVARRLQ